MWHQGQECFCIYKVLCRAQLILYCRSAVTTIIESNARLWTRVIITTIVMLMMILEDNSTDNELLARGQQAGLIEKKNWTHQEPSWNQIHWNSKYRWASNYQTQCDQLTNDEGNDTNFRFGQFFVRCMQHQPQSLVVSVLNHSLLLSTHINIGSK